MAAVGIRLGPSTPFTRARDDDDTAPSDIMDVETPQSAKHDVKPPVDVEELRTSFQKSRKLCNGEEADSEEAPAPRSPYNPYPASEVDEQARSSDDPFTPDKTAPGQTGSWDYVIRNCIVLHPEQKSKQTLDSCSFEVPEKLVDRLDQLKARADLKKKNDNGDGDLPRRGRGRGRGGRGGAAGRGRGRKAAQWDREDFHGMYTDEEWAEWMRWKGLWPEPVDQDNGDGLEEAPSNEGEGANQKSKSKKKTTKQEMKATAKAHADEKPKRKRKSNAEEPGEAEEPVTFARRYRPARAFESARWLALKEAFQKILRPVVDTPSSAEVWLLQYVSSFLS